ncbi:hypothetical protein D9757_007965 [Collybiopsis confluens]|uniref:Uncharacterized protein n=1 Tax=Collybiopsis confluens TaxID=2823264 RepID=A0A8H5HBK7_9AGAR|nr:hypothetical protein D9757_011719 [Collybiopsis confluens]KAF5380323.1 hypothetical protein D9757_007965 [Collybiopsis confluens]
MDSSAVNINITVDDFDSVLAYADQSVWTTPDPSSADYHPSSSQWLLGTYHKTDTVNATNTGPALYIYGFSGPDYGSYEVQLDGISTKASAFSSNNASTPHLLYGTNNLTYSVHELTLRNLGAVSGNGDGGGNSLLFDFLEFSVQLAPGGASVSNTTVQENDPSLTYIGTWGSNTSGNFSGGGSSFTNGDNASVSFPFNGSAIYIFGDKKNDHGLYSVTLDNGTEQIYNGISGCGGAFGMTCEQQQPTLSYFASNLAQGEHTLKITNLAGVNQSYFDLDSIVLTIPSTYAPRALINSSSDGSGSSGNSSSGSGSNSSPGSSNSALASSVSFSMVHSLLFLVLGISWLLRR